MGKKNAMSLTLLSDNSVTWKSEDGLSPELLVPNKITSELGEKKKKKSFLGLGSLLGNGRKMNTRRRKTAKRHLASIQRENIHFRKEENGHQIQFF